MANHSIAAHSYEPSIYNQSGVCYLPFVNSPTGEHKNFNQGMSSTFVQEFYKFITPLNFPTQIPRANLYRPEEFSQSYNPISLLQTNNQTGIPNIYQNEGPSWQLPTNSLGSLVHHSKLSTSGKWTTYNVIEKQSEVVENDTIWHKSLSPNRNNTDSRSRSPIRNKKRSRSRSRSPIRNKKRSRSRSRSPIRNKKRSRSRSRSRSSTENKTKYCEQKPQRYRDLRSRTPKKPDINDRLLDSKDVRIVRNIERGKWIKHFHDNREGILKLYSSNRDIQIFKFYFGSDFYEYHFNYRQVNALVDLYSKINKVCIKCQDGFKIKREAGFPLCWTCLYHIYGEDCPIKKVGCRGKKLLNKDVYSTFPGCQSCTGRST